MRLSVGAGAGSEDKPVHNTKTLLEAEKKKKKQNRLKSSATTVSGGKLGIVEWKVRPLDAAFGFTNAEFSESHTDAHLSLVPLSRAFTCIFAATVSPQ